MISSRIWFNRTVVQGKQDSFGGHLTNIQAAPLGRVGSTRSRSYRTGRKDRPRPGGPAAARVKSRSGRQGARRRHSQDGRAPNSHSSFLRVRCFFGILLPMPACVVQRGALFQTLLKPSRRGWIARSPRPSSLTTRCAQLLNLLLCLL